MWWSRVSTFPYKVQARLSEKRVCLPQSDWEWCYEKPVLGCDLLRLWLWPYMCCYYIIRSWWTWIPRPFINGLHIKRNSKQLVQNVQIKTKWNTHHIFSNNNITHVEYHDIERNWLYDSAEFWLVKRCCLIFYNSSDSSCCNSNHRSILMHAFVSILMAR